MSSTSTGKPFTKNSAVARLTRIDFRIYRIRMAAIENDHWDALNHAIKPQEKLQKRIDRKKLVI
jgi:hypothetical protein